MKFSVQQINRHAANTSAGSKVIAAFEEWSHASEFAKAVSEKRPEHRFYIWRDISKSTGSVDSLYEDGRQVR